MLFKNDEIYVTPSKLCPLDILLQGWVYTVDAIADNAIWVKEKAGADPLPFDYLLQVLYDENNKPRFCLL